MLKTKKIISFVLASVLTLTGFSNLILASGNGNIEAHAVLGSQTSYVNITNAKGNGTTLDYSVVTHDGKSGWKVIPEKVGRTDGKNGEIFFKLDDSAFPANSNYRNYEIEVEYFDEDTGRFRVMYDAIPDAFAQGSATNSVGKTEIVYTTGTKKWKTHSFIISDARFGNGYANCDFSLACYEKAMGVSEHGITFGRVSVRPINTYGTVQAKMSTANVGNNFFSEETVKINIELKNLSTSAQTVNAKFVAYNQEGNLAETFEFSKNVPASSSVTHVLDFEPKYGVYNAKLEVEGNNIFETAKIDYAYIVETEKNNPRMGIGNHSMRLTDRDYTKLIPIMDKVGYSLVRDGFRMDELYANNGHERPLTFPERNLAVRNAYKNAGLNHLIGLASEWMFNPYGSTKVDTDEVKNLFTQYAGDVAAAIKNEDSVSNYKRTRYYEALNEVNATIANWPQLGYSNAWYIEISKMLYDEIKAKDPNGKVVVGCTSYISHVFLREVLPEISEKKTILSSTFITPKFDEVSVHPYTFTTGPDEDFWLIGSTHGTYYDNMKILRDWMDSQKSGGQYYMKNIPIRVTEIGWSSYTSLEDPNKSITKMEQAAYLPQIFAIYSNPELNVSAVYYYDFINDGYDYTDIECNLGVLENWEVVDTPYLAKPGLLSLSFFNELLADGTHISRQDDDKYHIYEYSRPDGKHVVMAWTKPENAMDNVTFNISDANAKVYDMFGNEMNVLRNGTKISIGMQNRPVYIVGNFSGYSIDDSVEPVAFEKEVSLDAGKYSTYTVTKSVSDDLVATLEFPEDSKALVTSETGFVDNTKTFTIYSYTTRGKIVNAKLKITTPEGDLVKEEEITFKFGVKDMINIGHALTFGQVTNFDEVTEYNDNCIIAGYEGKKNVFEIRPNSTSGVAKSFTFDLQNSGTIKIGMDLNIAEDSFYRLFSQTQNNEGYVVFDNGEIKEWNAFKNWGVTPGSFANKVYYPADEWFRFEVEIDFSNYTEKYYINGNQVATSTFSDNPNNSNDSGTGYGHAVNFIFYAEAGSNGLLIDNVLVEKVVASESEVVNSARFTEDGRIEVTLTDEIQLPMSKNFKLTGMKGDAEINLGLSQKSPAVAGQNEFWTFDDSKLPTDAAGNWTIVDDADTEHGKVLRFDAVDKKATMPLETPWNSAENDTKQYLYSIDMYVADGTNHAAGDYLHFAAMHNGTIQDIALYAGLNKAMGKGNFYGWDARELGYAQTDKWERVDILLTGGTTRKAKLYLDGTYLAEYSLDTDVGKTPFDGIDKLWIWDQVRNDRSKIDNVRFKEVVSAYEVEIAKNNDGNLVVSFDDTVFLNKSNFKLYVAKNSRSQFVERDYTLLYNNGTKAIIQPATPFDENDIIQTEISALSSTGKPASATVLGIQKPVDLSTVKTASVSVEQVVGNKLYLLPGEMADGFVYTLTFNGLKKKNGSAFPSGALEVQFEEKEETKYVNDSWNFEDGKTPIDPAGSWTIIDDADIYRGKVLKFDAVDTKATFPLTTAWVADDERKFIYSFDMFVPEGSTHKTGDYLHFGALDSGVVQDIALYTGNGTLGKGIAYGWDGISRGACPTGVWERVDIVLTGGATKKASLYLDGTFLFEYSLANDTKGNPFDGFTHVWFWDQIKNDRSKLDNVRFKELSDTFSATAKWENGMIVIDFDETIKPVTSDDFVIYKSNNSLVTPTQSYARVVYQNGTRVVLEPYGHDVGTYFEIDANVTSFLGNKLEETRLDCVVGSKNAPSVGKVTFYDMNGNAHYGDDVTTDTAKVEISMPYGYKAGSDSIMFKSSSNAINYEKSWDEDAKILTLIPTSAVAASRNYTFSITAKSDDNKDYNVLSGTYRASSGKAVIKINTIETDSDGMYVNYSFANPTTSNKAYTIICAGYNGTKLITIGHDNIAANQKLAKYEDTFFFPTKDADKCDKFIVYIWDGINTMVPLTEDLVQK